MFVFAVVAKQREEMSYLEHTVHLAAQTDLACKKEETKLGRIKTRINTVFIGDRKM